MGDFTHLHKLALESQLSQGPDIPQAPPPQQPPIGGRGEDAVFAAEAVKTENFWVSFLPWQDGHSGSAAPITSFSKLLLHCAQTYSKIGIGIRYLLQIPGHLRFGSPKQRIDRLDSL